MVKEHGVLHNVWLNINMSCLSKLKNVPGVSALDQKIGLITPSVLQGRPLAQKIASAKQNLSAVTTEIGQQVSNQINNAINAVTGKIGVTANNIKGIGASLQALPQKFVNGLQSAANAIAKSAKAIGDTITCEATTLKDSITHAFETSELQTATQASIGAIAVSNNTAKELAENPVAKQAAITKETERVQTETAAIAVTTPSNNTVYVNQVNTINTLQTLTA